MIGVSAVTADSAHAFGRHTHDQFGIGVILRGAQTSLSGRGVVEAEAGDIITVNPGEVHDGAPLGDGGRAWRMLYFDPTTLAACINALTDGRTDSAELALPVLRDPAQAACFGSIFRATTDPCGGHSELEARENLLLLLARLVRRRADDAARSAPAAISRARARIDDDPSNPLSLDELATIGGISPFQLVRGFARVTGLTPHAYLIQRRLHLARQMIAQGAALADAAQASGFADQSHMTRLFVRTYGMSPGVYAAAMA
ncbi:MAG: AraC family transcriptional regulator [Pseudorhodobacter sp.]|nr:AraC family transcriptional regulator [Pseudorhodobacter sp.]